MAMACVMWPRPSPWTMNRQRIMVGIVCCLRQRRNIAIREEPIRNCHFYRHLLLVMPPNCNTTVTMQLIRTIQLLKDCEPPSACL
jgi:hypothetical protein